MATILLPAAAESSIPSRFPPSPGFASCCQSISSWLGAGDCVLGADGVGADVAGAVTHRRQA